MKALRIILNQASANYRREETVENKMTYPLPPLSTIIGAIHSACGFREYHPMDISVQGRYGALHKEPYTDHCFLNTVMDDRGILVKMKNGNLLSAAFEKVASAKNSTGNSFRNNITIQIYNQTLLNEYRKLKDLNDQISAFKKERLEPFYQQIKGRKKHLTDKKKQFSKGSAEYLHIEKREKEIKELEKTVKQRMEEYQLRYYTQPISNYRSLTTSLKFYEILDEIELIIHVRADERDLEIVRDNIFYLKSLGRSEDMVDVKEAKIVELMQSDDCNIKSPYSAYLGCRELEEELIFTDKMEGNRTVSGTKYYLNKDYEIINGRRVFHKKKVMYVSQYSIEETSDTVFIDQDDGQTYIVNLL